MPEFPGDDVSVGKEGFGRFCRELHDCYSSPIIIFIIGGRKIILICYVT
jgi:hypothetical protein